MLLLVVPVCCHVVISVWVGVFVFTGVCVNACVAGVDNDAPPKENAKNGEIFPRRYAPVNHRIELGGGGKHERTQPHPLQTEPVEWYQWFSAMISAPHMYDESSEVTSQ